jgi:hypothetical protein
MVMAIKFNQLGNIVRSKPANLIHGFALLCVWNSPLEKDKTLKLSFQQYRALLDWLSTGGYVC